MQELIEKVWENPLFHNASHRIQLAWLRQELGTDAELLDLEEANRLMRAAAILACSTNQEHRKIAFRVATCTYEIFRTNSLPFDQALRVVLARLGNFPSIMTRKDVAASGKNLPLTLATEEAASAESRRVIFNKKNIYLTDFQHTLWVNLLNKKRIALAAPTSAGKSFVLQHYLSSIFSNNTNNSVIYIVPTRALIAQVAEDLVEQFRDFEEEKPEIITIPIDNETPLPKNAIYVMTQERVQLALIAHKNFFAHIIIVDEAHSISEGARGVLLQWVIDDLLHRKNNSQILFASPTIRNLDVFGRLFDIKDVVEFSSVEPTVAQNFLITKIDSATKGKISIQTVGDGRSPLSHVADLTLNQNISSRIDKLVHISATLGHGQSNIIYANGAAEAENIAILLMDLFIDRPDNASLLALSELAKETVHPNYILVECVKKGIAFHYSNIPTHLRRAVEDAVSNGKIDYLICTSTLLQGVNLPAKNIFLCSPERGRRKAIESTDFWNLAGRAGRLLREFQGNIFLIDYDNWKKKPLDGPKDSIIIPAIENTIKNHEDILLSVINDASVGKITDTENFETVFVRLFSDHMRGNLDKTLTRLGITKDTIEFKTIFDALTLAEQKITIPPSIVRKNPGISVHKQQRLFDILNNYISHNSTSAKILIPKHPRESDAYKSYEAILEICYQSLLDHDTSKIKIYRFHALIARKWMLGTSLSQIIDDQIKRSPQKIIRTTIRDTLKLIENDIRFQAVRLFGCYNTLLTYALDKAGLIDLASSIPSLPLYLEIGASDKTMISFISLGLSRVTAMKLNALSARKDLDVSGALHWLRTRPLESFGLSPLLLSEVKEILLITH